MALPEKKIGLVPALLVALLAFGGFVGVATVVSNNASQLTPVSLAKDGEDDGDDNDDKDEDKDEDKDDDKDKDKESESDKKAKEEAKKKAEREREAAKKSAEQASKSSGKSDDSDDMVDGVKLRGDGTVDDDATDTKEDEQKETEGMYKDRAKTLAKLDEELAKAEKEILEKQAEGVDVTAALARLALAKAKVATVGGAFDTNDLEAAKELSKEVKKMAHIASHEDVHDAKEVAEDVAKISKRITQAYGKITLLEAVGGDGTVFRTSLATYEADLATLKATIAAGGYDIASMEVSLEALERKVKSVKSSVEGAIYALGGTDSRYDEDYEDEAADLAEHLNDVAEIEDDDIGRAIRGIAEDHESGAKVVGETVKSIDKHNPVAQALFGTSESDLASLEQEIVASKARTEALVKAADAIEDQDVKAIVLEQIETLKAETAKLETFVSGQRDRLSAFGWFFRLF